MKSNILIALLFFTYSVFAQPVIELEEFASGFTKPVGLIDAGDERVFVICQDGFLRIIDEAGVADPIPFLDISDRVESIYNAHGLLGAVFHPDYATNGFFYVNYINNDENSVISRFSVDPTDPDLADATSEEILLIVEQPYRVHKAGDMHFGPDGYLYFPFGDGGVVTDGEPGDPDNRAQNPQTYLGKMLRLDVDGTLPYEIPVTNPFYGAVDTLNEIWAFGLRNPWRFSFDKLTGEMWLPDVGHDFWEEINYEPAGFAGGNNYGWRCYESNAEYNFDSCDAGVDYTFPLFEYPHNDSTGGYSVTGGYVYRGTLFPGMAGIYFCCDFVTGNFYAYKYEDLVGWTMKIFPSLLLGVVSFGEDNEGELYCVVRETGIIYKLKDLCPLVSLTPSIINADCAEAMNGSIDLIVEGAIEPYSVLWSTGDSTLLIDSLMNGSYSVSITDSLGCTTAAMFDVLLNAEPIVIIVLVGGEFYAGEAESYQWYFNGVMIEGATSAYYYSPEGGFYTVEVTFMNGCKVMSEGFDWLGINISNLSGENVIAISPNPAHHIIDLRSYGPIDYLKYEIYSLSGSLVLKDNYFNKAINISSLQNGVYTIRIWKDYMVQTTYFVKQ